MSSCHENDANSTTANQLTSESISRLKSHNSKLTDAAVTADKDTDVRNQFYRAHCKKFYSYSPCCNCSILPSGGRDKKKHTFNLHHFYKTWHYSILFIVMQQVSCWDLSVICCSSYVVCALLPNGTWYVNGPITFKGRRGSDGRHLSVSQFIFCPSLLYLGRLQRSRATH